MTVAGEPRGAAKTTSRLSLAQSRAGCAAVVVVAASLGVAASELALRGAGQRPWAPRIELPGPEGELVRPHPTRGFTFRPGRFQLTEGGGQTFTMTHGADTFRITEPIGASDAARPQLWILGCSFTHGWSVSDDETYAWRLQRALPGYKVVNMGVSGYGTLQSLILLEEMLATRPAPRAVVLAYASFHDERNTLLRRFRKNVLVAQHFEPFNWPYARLSHDGFRVLYAHEVVRELPLMRRSALVYAFERFYDDEIEDRLLESHEVTKAILARLIAICRKRSLPVLVGDLSRDHASLDMLETARALGASTADMYVDLRLKENTNLPYDGHPSAWAHRQYAEKLLGALRAMGVS